jgi:hypothetical protein
VHPEPWIRQADPREIMQHFDGWEPEVRQLVAVRSHSMCTCVVTDGLRLLTVWQ